MNEKVELHPPCPPFELETAIQKVRAAEDGWNTRDPHQVSLAYSEQSRWRNRSEFVTGRNQIVNFLQQGRLRCDRVTTLSQLARLAELTEYENGDR